MPGNQPRKPRAPRSRTGRLTIDVRPTDHEVLRDLHEILGVNASAEVIRMSLRFYRAHLRGQLVSSVPRGPITEAAA